MVRKQAVVKESQKLKVKRSQCVAEVSSVKATGVQKYKFLARLFPTYAMSNLLLFPPFQGGLGGIFEDLKLLTELYWTRGDLFAIGAVFRSPNPLNKGAKKKVAHGVTSYSLLPILVGAKKKVAHGVTSYSLLPILVLSQVAIAAIAPVRAAENSSVQATESVAAVQLAQGKKYYEMGQYSAAAGIWERAAQAFAGQQDQLNQAQVLSDLSLAYQQLGKWQEATTAIERSFGLLQANKATGEENRDRRIAQALNTQGSLQLAQGQAETAVATWQKATSVYEKLGDRVGITRSLINQAQAFRALGLYRRALSTLTQVEESLRTQPDSQLKAAALRSLGTTLQLVGATQRSREVLQASLKIARKLNSPTDISATLLSLGNTARSDEDPQAALDYYQQAAAIATTGNTKVEAQLNQLHLLLDRQQQTAAIALIPKIQAEITNLPTNRNTIYAEINFARSLMKLGSRESLVGSRQEGQGDKGTRRQGGQGDKEDKGAEEQGSRGATTNNQQSTINNNQPTTNNSFPTPDERFPTPALILATAVNQARNLGDRRAEAYALGYLGTVYEQAQQRSHAQELFQQALMLAQAINAPDIAYNWQWQLGKLLKSQGDTRGAIAAYSEAVTILRSLRSDLVAINPDVQFSFRESVEPVYRELVGLLLQSDGAKSPTQANLAQARQVIESLQLAELDNFFREACLDTKPVQIDDINVQAAVIYPIILPERLHVILSLPGQPLRHYSTAISQNQIESEIAQFRQDLTIRGRRKFMPMAQRLYDWLIRPAQADLAKSKIKTLVFVPDGILRNVPMAALHDRDRYLIENYGIALAPSLQLLDPKPLPSRDLKVLTMGLSESRQGFAPLSYVPKELEQIHAEVPGVVLLNQKFTSNAFQNQLINAPFPIVHIATHGQFSSKAEQTFILSWDDRINVKQLDKILQPQQARGKMETIELLVLSACQTATGDKRAALGLAGIAVRAGARSTLATLWSVDDAATAELMTEFYRELATGKVTRAEALRRAQLKLIRNPLEQHPIYWSPFVLIGNWL